MSSTERRLENSAQLPWSAPASPGLMMKRLSEESPITTTLVKLDPGTRLPEPPTGAGQEIYVLEGSLNSERGELHSGGYSWSPAPERVSFSTEEGCVLFVKSGAHHPGDRAVVHLETRDLPWQQGQGGLRVKSLHSFEGEGTALVHWPAGESFVPHKHWGGEEIFVISGQFEDEHGEYPAGTWIQSPHLSAHHPFVKVETVIFVKTGHMFPA